MQPIQMQLLQKQNFFRNFFCLFDSYIKFQRLSKKDGTHSRRISEITDFEKCS